MHLKDVMTRDVEVVSPDAYILEAARTMKRLDVDPLPVCDGERLLGVITDRDIAVRGVAVRGVKVRIPHGRISTACAPTSQTGAYPGRVLVSSGARGRPRGSAPHSP